jgi:hypothetical protein
LGGGYLTVGELRLLTNDELGVLLDLTVG